MEGGLCSSVVVKQVGELITPQTTRPSWVRPLMAVLIEIEMDKCSQLTPPDESTSQSSHDSGRFCCNILGIYYTVSSWDTRNPSPIELASRFPPRAC